MWDHLNNVMKLITSRRQHARCFSPNRSRYEVLDSVWNSSLLPGQESLFDLYFIASLPLLYIHDLIEKVLCPTLEVNGYGYGSNLGSHQLSVKCVYIRERVWFQSNMTPLFPGDICPKCLWLPYKWVSLPLTLVSSVIEDILMSFWMDETDEITVEQNNFS